MVRFRIDNLIFSENMEKISIFLVVIARFFLIDLYNSFPWDQLKALLDSKMRKVRGNLSPFFSMKIDYFCRFSLHLLRIRETKDWKMPRWRVSMIIKSEDFDHSSGSFRSFCILCGEFVDLLLILQCSLHVSKNM